MTIGGLQSLKIFSISSFTKKFASLCYGLTLNRNIFNNCFYKSNTSAKIH